MRNTMVLAHLDNASYGHLWTLFTTGLTFCLDQNADIIAAYLIWSSTFSQLTSNNSSLTAETSSWTRYSVVLNNNKR